MKLIVPKETETVVRQVFPDKSYGLWHLMKGERMAHCNKYFSDPRYLDYSTLGEAEGDVCTICYPWGQETGNE